jgi:hypothetical protein
MHERQELVRRAATSFKSVASAISPHRRLQQLRSVATRTAQAKMKVRGRTGRALRSESSPEPASARGMPCRYNFLKKNANFDPEKPYLPLEQGSLRGCFPLGAALLSRAAPFAFDRAMFRVRRLSGRGDYAPPTNLFRTMHNQSPLAIVQYYITEDAPKSLLVIR